MKLSVKKYSIIILLFVLCLHGNSQTFNIDSLKKVLPSARGEERFKVLYVLAEQLEGTYPLQSLEYAKEAIALGEQLGKTDTVPTIYASASFASSQLGEFANALSYAFKSLDLATELGNKKYISSAHSTLGITYVYLGQYSKALEHHQEALRIREEIGLNYGATKTLNNIGVVYHNMGLYDKAIEYYKEVIRRRQGQVDTITLIRFNQNVGFAELKRGNLDTATYYHRAALAMAQKVHFEGGLAYSYFNLGLIKIEQQQFASAVENLQRAYDLYNGLGQKHGMVQVLNAMGDAEYLAGSVNNAIHHLEKAATLSTVINAADELKKSYEKLYTIYDKRKNTEQAYHYFKLYAAAKDSLFNSKESNKIAELSINHERLRKERELQIVKKENELVLERQQILTTFFTIGSIFLAAIVVMLYLYNRKIHEAKTVAETQNVELERLNGDLRDKIQEIKTLSGLLPICSHCKKIRNDEGYWEQLEGYISEHSDAKFSHGICPDCRQEFFPSLSQKSTGQT